MKSVPLCPIPSHKAGVAFSFLVTLRMGLGRLPVFGDFLWDG